MRAYSGGWLPLTLLLKWVARTKSHRTSTGTSELPMGRKSGSPSYLMSFLRNPDINWRRPVQQAKRTFNKIKSKISSLKFRKMRHDRRFSCASDNSCAKKRTGISENRPIGSNFQVRHNGSIFAGGVVGKGGLHHAIGDLNHRDTIAIFKHFISTTGLKSKLLNLFLSTINKLVMIIIIYNNRGSWSADVNIL